jgi:hypothetical protein
MSVNNGMQDFGEKPAQQPCSDCLITWVQAGLEYPNGTTANANTGLWLHHTVFASTASKALVCPTNGSYEHWFASGNERTPANICVNGTEQVGYYLASDTVIGCVTELMNMQDFEQEAILTVTYEFIPGIPAGFSKAGVLWLDIGQCKGSDMPAFPDQVFEYSSAPWTSTNTSGKITFIGAHLHDGGTHLEVFKNNKTICDCQAHYGESAGYIDPPGMDTYMNMSSMPGMDMSMDMVHVSSLSACADDGSLAVGDTMSITAHYNTSEYMPMTDMNGTLEPIMGISLVYIALGEVASANATGSNGTSGGTASSSAGATSTGSGAAASTTRSVADRVGSAGWMLTWVLGGATAVIAFMI